MVDKIKGQLDAYLVTNKVNLSKQRKDSILEKLAKKVTTEEEIQTAIEDYADFIVEIAKADDRARTLEANKPKPVEPVITEVEQPKDETPEWAKALLKEVEQLKTEKVQDALRNQFLSDEKVKGVPKTLLEALAPKSAEEYDTAIERANAIALEFNKSLPDTTPKTASANPKPATEVDIKNLAKEILN